MSGEPTGFLYPFIESEERNSASLLVDLAGSAREKITDSRAVRTATLERCGGALEAAAAAMADRFRRGGRLFTFGNGGSATDAEGAVLPSVGFKSKRSVKVLRSCLTDGDRKLDLLDIRKLSHAFQQG